MIYPKFLTPGSKVGICAPSAGIDAEDHAGFDRSLGHLKARGWQITETASVRAGGIESAPGPVRAAELNSLLQREDLDAILCASGGDFLLDMRPCAAVPCGCRATLTPPVCCTPSPPSWTSPPSTAPTPAALI